MNTKVLCIAGIIFIQGSLCFKHIDRNHPEINESDQTRKFDVQRNKDPHSIRKSLQDADTQKSRNAELRQEAVKLRMAAAAKQRAVEKERHEAIPKRNSFDRSNSKTQKSYESNNSINSRVNRNNSFSKRGKGVRNNIVIRDGSVTVDSQTIYTSPNNAPFVTRNGILYDGDKPIFDENQRRLLL